MIENQKSKTLGKWLLTAGTAIYTFIPPIVDILTPTHIFHPDWVGHARFHTMWAIISASTMGLLALWLIWRHSDASQEGPKIAGLISTGILSAFMIAALTMPLYGGSLTDPGGMQEAANGLDVNLKTFSVALALVLSGWRLAARTANR